MTNVGQIGDIAKTIDLGPASSLQFQFAKLQLALAEASKNSAMGYINGIQNSQEDQKKVSFYIQDIRKVQKTCIDGNCAISWGGQVKDYMTQHKLTYPDKTHMSAKEDWEVVITSLQAHLDQLGSDTQQKMVFVQDFMGQYNSYLQGANSSIQQSNQTTAELARAR
jgi:hypothetical protein